MSVPRLARRVAIAGVVGLALAGGFSHSCRGQGRSEEIPPQPATIFDQALDQLRKASVTWEVNRGPRRQQADVVCLVPDVPSFLEAVGTWDRGHFFPVLIDDAERNLKFLRAYRPARVVRLPGHPGPIDDPSRLWDAALEAVGRSWSEGSGGDGDTSPQPPPADVPPTGLGPTPPGVVVSYPGSPSLVAAVALAAGRFQPLVRWDPPAGSSLGDVLSTDQATRLSAELEHRVGLMIADYRGLGDRCDFITLAGEYPFRYAVDQSPVAMWKGNGAFDDLLGRSGAEGRRWAFVGRILGGPEEAAYQAMCSLFLQPDSALLFNTYPHDSRPWSDYSMDAASRTLGKVMPVALHDHDNLRLRADIPGWHRAFDPVNRAGLVMVNTKGGSTSFDVAGHPAVTSDVPLSEPAAVVMIHSYSAENPADPATLAGRWLANGAFAYFGSMNEPGVMAFRTPELVADLIARNVPLGAALRQNPPGEVFSFPWRLLYFGDPLFRLLPPESRPSPAPWPALDGWPTYREAPDRLDIDDVTRLARCLRTAFVRASAGPGAYPGDGLVERLLAFDRRGLPASVRGTLDALMVDALTTSERLDPLADYLATIPEAESSADVWRWRETVLAIQLRRGLEDGPLGESIQSWSRLERAGGAEELLLHTSRGITNKADAMPELVAWKAALENYLTHIDGHRFGDDIRNQLGQVTQAIDAKRNRPINRGP